MSTNQTLEDAKDGPALKLNSPRSNPTQTRTFLGLKDSAPVTDEHQNLEHNDLLWSRIRLALREPFAEFFGTFIMVSICRSDYRPFLLVSCCIQLAVQSGSIATDD